MSTKVTKSIKPTCRHISQVDQVNHVIIVKTNVELDFNLEFENMKFGQETLKQVAHGSKSIDLPFCIDNFHAPMPIVKKLKMN
jgi:hypothetical protein